VLDVLDKTVNEGITSLQWSWMLALPSSLLLMYATGPQKNVCILGAESPEIKFCGEDSVPEF
jgi:hypothetical protein